MTRLLNPTPPLQQDQYAREIGETLALLAKSQAGEKQAAPATTTYAMSGKLIMSESGWLLLTVPNSLLYGAFDALDEPGIELPRKNTNDPNSPVRAHISVMHKDETAKIGPERISERGKTFHYGLGPLKECVPHGWDDVSKCWMIEVQSPELKALRKSYGLTPLPHNNEFQFHITVAIRRKKVLQHNEVSKAASYVRVEVPGENEQYLLHHYLNSKRWGHPGGRIEDGEDPRTAAVRELLERTGYQASPEALTDLGPDGEFHGFQVPYESLSQVGKPQTETRFGPLPKSAGLKEDIDAAGADCEEPKSDEAAAAGNYRHGHCKLHGLDVTIETGKGMTRSGTASNGKRWHTLMKAHYGYIKRTKSESDGEHVDVFIGPNPESEVVFIVDQLNSDGKGFDEHKCMLGYTDAESAKQGYLSCYDKGWQGFGGICSLTMPQFKEWIKAGVKDKPLTGQKLKLKAAADTRRCPGCKQPFKKDEPYPNVKNCEVCERFGKPKQASTGENCPHCNTALERGDDGYCNHCGRQWPEEANTTTGYGEAILKAMKPVDDDGLIYVAYHPGSQQVRVNAGDWVSKAQIEKYRKALQDVPVGVEIADEAGKPDLREWVMILPEPKRYEKMGVAQSFYMQALRDAPIRPVPGQSLMQGVINHIGQAKALGDRRISQHGDWAKFQAAADPNQGLQQLADRLAGRTGPTVEHPLDRILQGVKTSAAVPPTAPARPKPKLRMGQGGMTKKPDASVLQILQQAAYESRRRNYMAKRQLLAPLLRDRRAEFIVDSRKGRHVGWTHTPTNFQFHLPAEVAS